MNTDAAVDFVLAIDFGGTKIAVATADSAGQIVQRMAIPTRAEQGAEQAAERGIETGRRLTEATQAARGGKLMAVGIATMGVTFEDRVLLAPNVPGWGELSLPSMMREAFGTDAVHLANDVKAAAAAEVRWGALQTVSQALYVNLGTGLVAVPIVGGEVVQGAHGAAGEIGYNLRHLHEPLGAVDGRTPLEEFVGGGAIAARARRRFGPACTPEALFAAAASDGQARSFVEEVMSEIAYHLTNLAIALDPSRIAVGGGMMRSQSLILPYLRTHLTRFVPFPPDLVPGKLLLDAALYGGIALALTSFETGTDIRPRE